MLAAIASAALIVAGSLAVGQALLGLCGRREWTWLSGPVGLALLLVAAGAAAGLGARGTALALVLVVLVVAGIATIALRGVEGGVPGPAVAAGTLAALFAAVPFIAAGSVGILGVGLVNDDMASHLLLADWISERFRPEPVLIDQGYPLGPHALVAGLGSLLGAGSIDVFAGLVLAIPALTALVAYSALDGLRTVARVAAAALVALPYLAAAYLAQEAFKEPIMALFVLTFALLLPLVKDWRDAVPLGALAAGVTYVYSFPGLAWLAGVALVWGAIELGRGWEKGRGRLRSMDARTVRSRDAKRLPAVLTPALALTAVAVLTLVVLSVPEIGRLLDFADFRALHPGQANEGGLGNLPGQLSPLEALGIWPTSEFRLSAAASSLPAAIFYLGGAFALVCLGLGLPRWIRRHGAAIPAALVAAVVLYLLARGLGTVYTSAKALAIAAPLIALITLGGLLGSERRPLAVAGAAFAVLVAACSLLILRQAPVAPSDHADELARIRPLVDGEKLLFLGRDNFVLYELRGSKPYTHVRNFYDPYFVTAVCPEEAEDCGPNFALTDVGSKFDFDSVTANALARFPYVLTTRAAYASGPPPGYEPIEKTDSYVLWEKGRSPLGRVPAETDAAPGRLGACPPRRPNASSSFAAAPVVAEASEWSTQTLESGETSTVELRLPAGEWDLSLEYDATRPVTLSSEGEDSTLPGNLDYRGTAPFWPAGTVSAQGPEPVRITATVEEPPLAGRVLGAHSVAHLGAIAATTAAPRHPACEGYADWYVR